MRSFESYGSGSSLARQMLTSRFILVPSRREIGAYSIALHLGDSLFHCWAQRLGRTKPMSPA